MTAFALKVLLDKYFNENISAEELIILEDILEQMPEDEIQEVLFLVTAQHTSSIKLSSQEVEDRLASVLSQLLIDIEIGEKQKSRFSYSKELLFVITTLLCAIFLFLYTYYKPVSSNQPIVYEDVLPAQSLANISFSNGDLIQIDSSMIGLIYENKGIELYRTINNELIYKCNNELFEEDYLTVYTPKAAFTKLILSDGTKVSLNANSRITCPVNFGSKSRDISAEGELYFDVAKDKNRPFRINTSLQVIEVLGTSFNLKTSPKFVKTTLVEGSVKIKVGAQDYFLKPGQQSVVSNSVKISDVKLEHEIAWKKDQFIFDNSSFFEILKEVEDWYDVSFSFLTDNVQDVDLSGTVSRQVKLSELLKVLELNTNYKFEIQERRVLVKLDTAK